MGPRLQVGAELGVRSRGSRDCGQPGQGTGALGVIAGVVKPPVQDGGDVGLVIYSDRPFTASPLTEDGEVIRQMLPELSTNLMPVLGNRADLAIAKATDLLKNAGASGGNLGIE